MSFLDQKIILFLNKPMIPNNKICQTANYHIP